MSRPPVALTIAGSDPSGGAGIQADLKTFSALGAYGTAVITALTAQNTRGVTGIHVVPAEFVRDQCDTLLADVRVDAIKIGMLADADIVRAVGEVLHRVRAQPDRPHLVLDPVMVATSGDRLLDEEAVAAVRELLPLADLITPNLPEAGVLLDVPVAPDHDAMAEQADALRGLGVAAVLLKGGHRLDAAATDVYADAAGTRTLTARRVDTTNTHGTGCTLSSALAALRPQRPDWASTVADAKAWLTGALAAADELEIGSGHGPVHHFYDIWSTR